ncbi:MAG: hypothetical protein ABR520_00945 [Mycobacteriales bacterium]|nr:hypothetical protein [Frankia sp.]
MLASAISGAFSTLRRAGWRPWLLAVLSWTPVLLVAAFRAPAFAVVALLAQNWILLALIANLGARRQPPVTAEHTATLRGSARRAVAQIRAGSRYTLLEMLAFVTSIGLLLALSRGNALAQAGTDDALQLTIAGQLARVPLFALVSAFILVAPQRIALENDPRVLVAAAHAVRVARAHFGTVFAIALAEPAAILIGLAIHRGASIGVLASFVAVLVIMRTLVTATATEVYVTGPRLDVPPEFGRRRG